MSRGTLLPSTVEMELVCLRPQVRCDGNAGTVQKGGTVQLSRPSHRPLEDAGEALAPPTFPPPRRVNG